MAPAFGRGDEDEGSPSQDGANCRSIPGLDMQPKTLLLDQRSDRKIESSAEALRVRQRPPSFPPEKSTHLITLPE